MMGQREDYRIARNKKRFQWSTIFVLSIYVVAQVRVVSQPPEHHAAKQLKDTGASNSFAENPVIEFTGDHFRKVGSSFARTFPVKNLSNGICISERNKRNNGKNANKRNGKKNASHPFMYTNDPRGVFYVKVPKSASTTLAGINHRIARRYGERVLGGHECVHNENHLESVGQFYGNRDVARSFLWGSVRDPASRAISRIFFLYISGGKIEPTDKNITTLLNSTHFNNGAISDGQGGFHLRYMTVKEIPAGSFWSGEQKTMVLQPGVLRERVQAVILDYDFVAVTERMDESLVALQLLMGLRLGDILLTSSKVGGTFSRTSPTAPACIEIQKSFISKRVKEYLASDEWYAKNYGDYLLYAAANRSLDLTIEGLGRDRFEGALRKYRQAKALVDERCASKVFFPCSANGTSQDALSERDCYNKDQGCGYPCVDALLEAESWLEN
jgi:hypothetical protein